MVTRDQKYSEKS